MSFILDNNSKIEDIQNYAGGKAYNLYRLSNLNLPVPKWFVISSDFFDKIINSLPDLNKMDHLEIEDVFLNLDINTELEKLLLPYIKNTDYAVRSSATSEDSAEHSFAGQFSSYLYVSGMESIIIAIKKCWASAFSARSLAYRNEQNIINNSFAMAVVIQEMIDADTAGVCFSRNPININRRNELIISSVYGAGEGLVSGLLDSDTFYVNRNELTIVTSEIATKKEQLKRSDVGGLTKLSVSKALQSQASLNADDIKQITKLAVAIEDKLQSPQDIEWVIKDNKVYLVQTRPITNYPPPSFFDKNVIGNEYILWDNSNITESYSGITLPLTFSHISKVYRQVYIQFCQIMGVPSKLINQHDSTFRNMLGLVNGRVYYNLRNWYHMLFLFPASSKSNKFMETMMGVKQGLNPEMEQMFEFTKNPPNYNPLHRLWILTVNAYRIFNTKKIIAKFKSDFEIIYQAGLETNYSEMNIQELISYYNYLNVEFVGRWKAPIISDTRCMIFFGVLKALCDKWLSDIDNKNLFNDLLAGQELPSSEPTLRLIEIAETLRNHFPDKTDWFINSSNQIVLESIKNYELPEVSTRFYEFIKLYGFRCVDELKLESIDLHEDSSFAIEAIRNFLKNPNISSHEILKREKHKAQLAETTIYNELSFLKRKIILFFTALTKNAVKDREDLRLLRTNSFGLCRKIFKNLGDRFYKLNLINQPSDIFFLAVDEIINYCEGRSFETDLKLLINVRREQYQQYEELSSPPDRFVTRGITGANFYYHQTLEDLLALDDVVSTDPNYLHGTACSPGVVEGVVRVVFNIEQATNLNGEILVCERTDPGWVPLFPSCSALIVERGSLLSHSAVVARELGIPTIVGVRGGVMKRLKTGMRIRMNGGNGDIFILQE